MSGLGRFDVKDTEKSRFRPGERVVDQRVVAGASTFGRSYYGIGFAVDQVAKADVDPAASDNVYLKFQLLYS